MYKLIKNIVLSTTLSVVAIVNYAYYLNAMEKAPQIPVDNTNFLRLPDENYEWIVHLVNNMPLADFRTVVNGLLDDFEIISDRTAITLAGSNIFALLAKSVDLQKFDKVEFLIDFINNNIARIDDSPDTLARFAEEQLRVLISVFFRTAEPCEQIKNKIRYLVQSQNVGELKITFEKMQNFIPQQNNIAEKRRFLNSLFPGQNLNFYNIDPPIPELVRENYVLNNLSFQNYSFCSNEYAALIQIAQEMPIEHFNQNTDIFAYADGLHDQLERESIMGFKDGPYYAYAMSKYAKELANAAHVYPNIESVMSKFRNMIRQFENNPNFSLIVPAALLQIERLAGLNRLPPIGEMLSKAQLILGILGEDQEKWKKWISIFAGAAWSNATPDGTIFMTEHKENLVALLKTSLEKTLDLNKYVTEHLNDLDNKVHEEKGTAMYNANQALINSGIKESCDPGWKGYFLYALSVIEPKDPGLEFFADTMQLEPNGTKRAVKVQTHNIFFDLLQKKNNNDKEYIDYAHSNKEYVNGALCKKVRDRIIEADNLGQGDFSAISDIEGPVIDYLKRRVNLIISALFPDLH